MEQGAISQLNVDTEVSGCLETENVSKCKLDLTKTVQTFYSSKLNNWGK